MSQIPHSCAKLWLCFQNQRRRPPSSCFSKNDNFGNAFYYVLIFFTSLPNLMRIRPSTAWKWHFHEIQIDGGCQFGFHEGAISLVLVRWYFMVVLCTHAKNVNQITRSCVRLSLFFAKSKMAAVRHFGIVTTSFKTIRVECLVMSWLS